jgi:FkbM family methyltransferase
MAILQKIINDNIIQLIKNEMSETYEEELSIMFRWMESISLPAKPVIFDVGANIGLFSLAYANLFPNSLVYGFEPVPFIYKMYLENIKLNNKNIIDRIIPFEIGFSNKRQRLSLGIPNKETHKRYGNNINIGLYSVHAENNKKINASFTTIDTFVIEKKINTIDLIKIDVEGHEYEVLDGARQTIKKLKPIIVMEYNELTRRLSDHTAIDFQRYFNRYEYSIYALEYGWKKELKKIISLKDATNISDIVCINNGDY